MSDFTATCLVCGTHWGREAATHPPATFCPVCQRERRVAPGVLNWEAVAQSGRKAETDEIDE